MIDEKELALATEHPRGTERRRLAPYRAALNDVRAYTVLPEADRDVIVRWAEIRRRLRDERGIDHDPVNFADPLLEAKGLIEWVIAGERRIAGTAGATPANDVIAAVTAIRRG